MPISATDEAKWEGNYRALQERGHYNVPLGSGKLGKWVGNQRSAHKKGALPHDRAARLEKIGFKWQAQDGRWEGRLAELKDFAAQHGHCNVSNNGALGRWVAEQRTLHRKGTLPPRRSARLEALGFAWGVRAAANKEAWEERCRELAEWEHKQGHCDVPKGNNQLAHWVAYVRKRRKKGKLSEERIAQLDELGFDWAPGEGGAGEEGAGGPGGRGGTKLREGKKGTDSPRRATKETPKKRQRKKADDSERKKVHEEVERRLSGQADTHAAQLSQVRAELEAVRAKIRALEGELAAAQARSR